MYPCKLKEAVANGDDYAAGYYATALLYDVTLDAVQVAGAAKATASLSRIVQGTSKVTWGMWTDLEKVAYNGRTYAKINGRFYTQEAIDRMTPSGYGTAAGGYSGRGIPPSVVEDVITNGVSRPVEVNNEIRTIYELNGMRVVTAENGRIVITAYPY